MCFDEYLFRCVGVPLRFSFMSHRLTSIFETKSDMNKENPATNDNVQMINCPLANTVAACVTAHTRKPEGVRQSNGYL